MNFCSTQVHRATVGFTSLLITRTEQSVVSFEDLGDCHRTSAPNLEGNNISVCIKYKDKAISLLFRE